MRVSELSTLALGYLVLGILCHPRAVAIAGRLDAEIALVGRGALNQSSVHLDMLGVIDVGVDGGEHDRIVGGFGVLEM